MPPKNFSTNIEQPVSAIQRLWMAVAHPSSGSLQEPTWLKCYLATLSPTINRWCWCWWYGLSQLRLFAWETRILHVEEWLNDLLNLLWVGDVAICFSQVVYVEIVHSEGWIKTLLPTMNGLCGLSLPLHWCWWKWILNNEECLIAYQVG